MLWVDVVVGRNSGSHFVGSVIKMFGIILRCDKGYAHFITFGISTKVGVLIYSRAAGVISIMSMDSAAKAAVGVDPVTVVIITYMVGLIGWRAFGVL